MDVRVERVFGASKFDQKVTRAPASVSVITADEIRKFGYRTLAEILRSVRGTYISYDSTYSYFGNRGFQRPGDYNSRVLLLVDGQRLNDDLFGQALLGTEEVLDVDLIERVEFIRGPGSSIYGNNAFFGVINIVTRNAVAIGGLEASADGGSLGSRKGRLTYGRQFADGAGVVLSGSLADSDGHDRIYYPEYDTPDTNHGVAQNVDSDHSQSLFGALSYGGLSLEGGYSLRGKQIPNGLFGTVFNDPRTQNWDGHEFVNLKYVHDFGGTQVSGRLYYDHYRFFSNYPYDFSPPGVQLPAVVLHDDDYSDGLGAQLELTRKLFDIHTLLVGAEIHDSPHLYQSEYSGAPPVYDFQDDARGHWLGLYTQDEIVLRKDLLLNAGLRYDHYSDFGGTVSPRAALIYNPKEDTAIKLLYGKAYQAPNAFELYFAVQGLRANPFLKPETIQTYEIDYEKYFPGHLRLSLSAYHYNIAKLIAEVVDPTDANFQIFLNTDSLSANGGEIELEYHPDSGALVRGSYAYQRATDRTLGHELDNSPRHIAKTSFLAPLGTAKLFAGFEVQYTSTMMTNQSTRSDGFVIANATLFAHDILKNLDLSASLYNLFDRRYTYPSSGGLIQSVLLQDGRTVRVKATYRF